MNTTARILTYDPKTKTLLLKLMEDVERDILQKEVEEIGIHLNDGRSITAGQRKKCRAIIADISRWSGHEPEYIHFHMKWEFAIETDRENFSLSDTDSRSAATSATLRMPVSSTMQEMLT